MDDYKKCLSDLGYYRFEKELCEEFYPDDATQLDGRYECFKDFGLNIPKDREYCEKKNPKDMDLKYKCI